jgi:hypothetical protein
MTKTQGALLRGCRPAHYTGRYCAGLFFAQRFLQDLLASKRLPSRASANRMGDLRGVNYRAAAFV